MPSPAPAPGPALVSSLSAGSMPLPSAEVRLFAKKRMAVSGKVGLSRSPTLEIRKGGKSSSSSGESATASSSPKTNRANKEGRKEASEAEEMMMKEMKEKIEDKKDKKKKKKVEGSKSDEEEAEGKVEVEQQKKEGEAEEEEGKVVEEEPNWKAVRRTDSNNTMRSTINLGGGSSFSQIISAEGGELRVGDRHSMVAFSRQSRDVRKLSSSAPSDDSMVPTRVPRSQRALSSYRLQPQQDAPSPPASPSSDSPIHSDELSEIPNEPQQPSPSSPASTLFEGAFAFSDPTLVDCIEFEGGDIITVYDQDEASGWW